MDLLILFLIRQNASESTVRDEVKFKIFSFQFQNQNQLITGSKVLPSSLLCRVSKFEFSKTKLPRHLDELRGCDWDRGL